MSIDCIKSCLLNKLISIFCLTFHLTGVHFRDELRHLTDVNKKKKCGLIRTSETTDIKLLDEPYINIKKKSLTAKHEIKPRGYAFQGAFYTSAHFAFSPFFLIMERSPEEEFSFFWLFPFFGNESADA